MGSYFCANPKSAAVTLAVVADDFGETEGNTRAAVEAHQRGIVTDAAIFPLGDFFSLAAELARAFPTLGIIVHLYLDAGRSQSKPVELSRIAWAVVSRRLTKREIEDQFADQVRRVMQSGLRPAGISFHRHISILPQVFEAGLRVARSCGLFYVRRVMPLNLAADFRLSPGPDLGLVRSFAVGLAELHSRAHLRDYRFIYPDTVAGLRYSGMLNEQRLRRILTRLEPGRHDLMCHPGYACKGEPGYFRKEELDALCCESVRQLVRSRGIRLVRIADWQGAEDEHRDNKQA